MKSQWVVSAFAAPLVLGSLASADPLVLHLTEEFSGAQQPGGSLKATFTDVTPGVVSLKLESLLVGSEFVEGSTSGENKKGWYFNFEDASLDVSDLSILGDLSNAITTTFFKQTDTFKADGDGLYDLVFVFGDRFGAGDADLLYTITGGLSLTASDFNFLSKPDGGNGPFTSAAHVQGVFDPAGAAGNSSGSGWIAPDPGDGGPGLVPLPAAAVGGALLMGLIARGRTRSKI